MIRLIFAVLLILTSAVAAQEAPATQPAEPQADDQTVAAPAMAVTVVAVEGPVQVKDCSAEAPQWSAATEGMTLGELHVIRTGFGGSAELALGDNSTARVEPCTQIGVRQFAADDETTRTRVGLKYGMLQVDVERERGPNDYAVEAPVGTLAARGSGNTIGFTDLGLQVDAHSGQWALATPAGEQAVAAGEGADGDLTPWSRILARRVGVQLGPQGLTGSELAALLNWSQGLGIVGFNGPNGVFGPRLFQGLAELTDYSGPPVPTPSRDTDTNGSGDIVNPNEPIDDYPSDDWYYDGYDYPNGNYLMRAPGAAR